MVSLVNEQDARGTNLESGRAIHPFEAGTDYVLAM
jgi:hypothetical protein